MNAGICSTSSIPLRRSSQRLLTLTSTTQLWTEREDTEGIPCVLHLVTIQLWTVYLSISFWGIKILLISLFFEKWPYIIWRMSKEDSLTPVYEWIRTPCFDKCIMFITWLCCVDAHERGSLQHTGTHTIHHTLFADSKLIVNVPYV